MSLTATLLLGQPITMPDGRQRLNAMDKSKRRTSKPVAVYRKKQATGRAANLQRLVDAVAAGANTMQAAATATGLSLSMVKKAFLELEDKGRIVRTNGRSIPHLFRVGK